MEFVIRERKPHETVWKVKYYDCDLNTTGNLSDISFESAEVAEAYGKVHYAYENTGNTSYQGVVEVKEDAGYMTSDANHWGVMYYSKDKERLQKFSRLLEEEGAAMCSIVPAFDCKKLVVCDIDKEWDGSNDINPFYFWYYKVEQETTVDVGDYEEPEDEDLEEYERELQDEEECKTDLVWEEMEDALLGRRRRR